MRVLARRRAIAFSLLIAVAAMACGGDSEPSRTVAGSFDFEVERQDRGPDVAPSLQEDVASSRIRTNVSEEQARRVAQDILLRADVPGLGDDLVPGDTFLATGEEIRALADATGLQLPEADGVYWIVNIGELGPRQVPIHHHGAVVNANTGEVTNLFYNRISPVSPAIAEQARPIAPESGDGIRATLETRAMGPLGQKYPHLLDTGVEIRSEFPVLMGGQAIAETIAQRELATDLSMIDPGNDYWLLNLVASGSTLLEAIVDGVPVYGSQYYFAVIGVDDFEAIVADSAGGGILLPGVIAVGIPRAPEPTVVGQEPTRAETAPTATPIRTPSEAVPSGVISADEALDIAVRRLRGQIFPVIREEDEPVDLFLLPREDLTALRQSGQLAFSPRQLAGTSDYVWIVNYHDQRSVPGSTRHTGVIIDGGSGTVIVVYLAAGSGIPRPPE